MSRKNASEAVEVSQGPEHVSTKRRRRRLSTCRLGGAALVAAGGVAAVAAGPAQAFSGIFYLIGSHAYDPCVPRGSHNGDVRKARSWEVSAYGGYRCTGAAVHGTVYVGLSGVYPLEGPILHAQGSSLQTTTKLGPWTASSSLETDASLVYSKNPYSHYVGAWSQWGR